MKYYIKVFRNHNKWFWQVMQHPGEVRIHQCDVSYGSKDSAELAGQQYLKNVRLRM